MIADDADMSDFDDSILGWGGGVLSDAFGGSNGSTVRSC